ncbi:MAG TPA: hypothetical protein PLI41_08195, partial [Bacteroidales bacterium]|nr:hypothetical protein [Bacteroidales bacterium]
MNRYLVFLLFLCCLISSCRNRSQIKTSSDLEAETMIPIKDSSYLFNGVSLDGWEITNFGPQGPVSVSGGQIVLGM